MNRKRKSNAPHSGKSAVLLLLCIIVGGWLYQQAPNNEATTEQDTLPRETPANEQEIDPLPSSCPQKIAEKPLNPQSPLSAHHRC